MTTATRTVTAVEPGTPEWEECKAEAVRSESNNAWLTGDIALRIWPVGAHGQRDDAAKLNLVRFAEETGIKFETLDKRRRTSHWYDEGTRVPSFSWKVHSILASEEGRKKLLAAAAEGRKLTVTDAHALASHSTAGRTKVPSAEQQATRLAKIVPDDVAVMIRQDPTLLNAVGAEPIKAFLATPAADRVMADILRPLQEELDRRSREAQEARRQLAEAEAAAGITGADDMSAELAATQDELDAAQRKIEQLNRAVANNVSGRRLSEDKLRTTREQKRELDQQAARMRRRIEELERELAEQNDPDRLRREKARDQYRTVEDMLLKCHSQLNHADAALAGRVYLSDGQREELLRTAERLSMVLTGVAMKLGKDITATL